MAFYDYIVLDGLKYRTLAKQWKPQVNKPATARVTLQGEIEATFGVTNILKWQGIIVAPVTAPAVDFGTVDTLRTSLKKREIVSFSDHYGTEYQVVVTGPFDEQYIQNVWNAVTNKVMITVEIMTTQQ